MILVTGGTGYIGSHTCVALTQANHDIVIVDNLSNSRASVIDRLESLCGKRPHFIEDDIRDAALLDRIFADHPIHAVIHFPLSPSNCSDGVRRRDGWKPCVPMPGTGNERTNNEYLYRPQALHRLAQKTLRQRAHILGLDPGD